MFLKLSFYTNFYICSITALNKISLKFKKKKMNYNQYSRLARSVSNSNPSLDRPDYKVEYEVSVPIVPSFRHTPYHSLWDLHQW